MAQQCDEKDLDDLNAEYLTLDNTTQAAQEQENEDELQETQEEIPNFVPNQQCDMMGRLRVKADRKRKHSFEWQHEAAAKLAHRQLRSRPTIPPALEAMVNVNECIDQCQRLPPVSCAFKGCDWNGAWSENISNDTTKASESPYDRQLRDHVLNTHIHQIKDALNFQHGDLWDVYKQAISVKERENVPVVGPAIDRRSIDHTLCAYNDRNIKYLICFACARIRVTTPGARPQIEYVSGDWLLALPPGSLWKNFAKKDFDARYAKPGSPLASTDPRPDFEDWTLRWHPDLLQEDATNEPKNIHPDVKLMGRSPLLCCPEDQRCEHNCVEQKFLCRQCQIPLCCNCQSMLKRNRISPCALINDNFYGYNEAWIHDNKITWMENTVSTPFWTGLLLFSIDSRHDQKRRRHLLNHEIYETPGRTFFKGQLFTAPLNWQELQHQLEKLERTETHISLPVSGGILASRVRITIAAGLVDVNRLLKQATVRRHIVVELIRMRKKHGSSRLQKGRHANSGKESKRSHTQR